MFTDHDALLVHGRETIGSSCWMRTCMNIPRCKYIARMYFEKDVRRSEMQSYGSRWCGFSAMADLSAVQ